MLPDAPDKVIRVANIERAVSFVCDDVDMESHVLALAWGGHEPQR